MRLNNFWTYRRIILSGRFARAVWRSTQNIVAASRGYPPVSGPYMAELDVTYRCNCRCGMCQRWRDTRRGELTLEEYQHLAAVFFELGVHQVSIGEVSPCCAKISFPLSGVSPIMACR
jgi:hypothetical protein